MLRQASSRSYCFGPTRICSAWVLVLCALNVTSLASTPLLGAPRPKLLLLEAIPSSPQDRRVFRHFARPHCQAPAVPSEQSRRFPHHGRPSAPVASPNSSARVQGPTRNQPVPRLPHPSRYQN